MEEKIEKIENVVLNIQETVISINKDMTNMKENQKSMSIALKDLQESVNYIKFMDERRDEKIAGLVDGQKVIFEKLDSIEKRLDSHQFELDDHDIRISALESKKVANQ